MYPPKIYSKARLWVLATCCSIAICCHAQQTENIFLRKYMQQDGLSSFLVRQVVQDKHGFLYIATQEGLDRFDGKVFTHYRKNSEARSRLGGVDIRAIAEDTTNNLLWVLPGENGVNAINSISGSVEQFIPLPKENDNEWNLGLLLCDEKLLVATTLGVRVYDTRKRIFYKNLAVPLSASGAKGAYEARAMGRDTNGNIWVCYNGLGIIQYNNRFQVINMMPASDIVARAAENNSLRFNKLVFVAPGTALIATNYGLRKVQYISDSTSSINHQPAIPAVNEQPVQSVFLSRNGDVYVANSGNLYRFNSSLQSYNVMQELLYEEGSNWLANVVNIFEDKDKNIWLGCNQGLAYFKTASNPFSIIYQLPNSNERLEHVTSVFKSSRNELFIGSFNGLYAAAWPYNTYKVFDKGYIFHQVFEDPYHRIVVSRTDSMFIFRDNRLEAIEKVYPEFLPFRTTALNSRVLLNDSIILLGTENSKGLLVWNYKRHSIEQLNETNGKVRLGSGIVNGLFKDSHNNTWVLSDHIITILENNLRTATLLHLHDFNSRLPAGLFFDMCELDGKFYVASYGTGIIVLDEKRRFEKILSTRNGLPNDGVYKIFPYKHSLLTSSNYGLASYDTRSGVFKNYFRADGLHSNNFEEAVGFVINDTIFTGGIRGVSVIQPQLLHANEIAPSLYINRVSLQNNQGNTDSTNLFLQQFTVPSNTLQATIYFSGLNFSNPDRTTFAYRIKGKTADWINIGSQNYVTLTGLAPGTYHLQVRAANEDEVWSEPKEIVLKFLPKWYQAWWFKVLVLFAAITIIYALYRYRIAQLKKQHEIRKNIATDLHDDLGSTLTSVKVFTNLAISGINQEASLQQVKDNLTEATMSLRDMIWVLDDSLDTVDELITRLKHFALPVAQASNINAQVKADGEINNLRLTKEEKRNLFLICKEAINNSIKYSGASNISVIIFPQGKKIRLVITDDGKGFDPETIKRGYGLKNMEYRAGQVGYKVKLSSQPGSGAMIVLQPV